MAHWEKIFDDFDVWWAPIQSPAEVFEDPQAAANGAFIQTKDMQGNDVRSVNSPISFHGHTFTEVDGPPEVGADTEAVLAELGYTENEVATMFTGEVVGPSTKKEP